MKVKKSILIVKIQSWTKKLKVAKKAKELGLDEIYNILNQMCLDEAKYGKSFETLSNEYFVAK